MTNRDGSASNNFIYTDCESQHLQEEADLANLSTDIRVDLRARLANAKVTEILSDRNDKLLTREIEPNGSEFVRRHYTHEGQTNVTMTNLHVHDFKSAWKTMENILDEAELPKVRSILLESNDDSAIIISDYLPDTNPVAEASTETKKLFATRLAKCFVATTSGRLSLPILNADGFAVTDDGKNEEIILLDVDPYVQHPMYGLRVDEEYIRRLCELFWDDWCTAEEKPEVIGALLRTIVENLTDDQIDESDLLGVISNANMMANGHDPRARRSITF